MQAQHAARDGIEVRQKTEIGNDIQQYQGHPALENIQYQWETCHDKQQANETADHECSDLAARDRGHAAANRQEPACHQPAAQVRGQ